MLNFAFVGCGNVAKFHADVIYEMGHQISAVCARQHSPNIKPFAERYRISKTYYDWQEMLKNENPDAVIVAVSWDQTEHVAGDIIKYGIPCLIEKPVALSSLKLERIISDTNEFQNNVMVGYNRRFYDFIPNLKKAVESQKMISIDLNLPEVTAQMVKLHSNSVSEHVLLYMSSHWLDLLMYLIGDLKVDYMHRGQSNGNLYDSFNGILYSLRYNIPVHLQMNFNSPSQIAMVFNFSDAVYKLSPVEILTVYKGMERLEPDNKIKFRRYIPKIAEIFEVTAAHKPGFYLQMENFIETRIKHNFIDQAGCTLMDALRVTKLCEQIKG